MYVKLNDFDYGFLPDDFDEDIVLDTTEGATCTDCWSKASPDNPVRVNLDTGYNVCHNCIVEAIEYARGTE